LKLEVLVSSLENRPEELIRKMHIETDAVIVNQCGESGREEVSENGNRILIISDDGRGVGRSRNLCLENSTDELVLFSDEDITYDEGYAKKVIDAFSKNTKADLLLFNVRVDPKRKTYWNEAEKKVTKLSCGRYPAYSIAARREALLKAGVKYSLLFGGGAKYSNGEDSLFLTDCLRKGLKIFTSTEVLGEEEYRQSTWFNGFNEKYFHDRGVLFAFLYRGWAKLWAFRFVYLKKNIETGSVGRKKAWKLINEGIKEGKRIRQ
jgi:glycosyltransferase involved in cell wall biosynthesis